MGSEPPSQSGTPPPQASSLNAPAGAPGAAAQPRRLGDEIEIPGDYQYAAAASGFPVQRYWHAAKLKLIEEVFPIAGTDAVLDCGCGSGVVTSYAAARCREAVGVDGNPRAVEFASSKFPAPNLRFINALVEDLDFPPGHFDKAICLEVIEHLYRPQVCSLLSRFAELLRPGGQLFLTTPNYRGLWPLVEWAAARSGKVPPMGGTQHVTRYGRASLERDVAGAGFRVLRAGTFSTFAPFLAAVSTRLADAAFGAELRASLPFGNILYLLAQKP